MSIDTISLSATEFLGDNLPVIAGDKPATPNSLQGRPVMEFIDGSDEIAAFSKQFKWPTGYAGGTINVKLAYWGASANGSSLKVDWEVAFEAVTPLDSLDMDSARSFATAKSVVATPPSTQGHLQEVTISFSAAEADNIAVGDWVTLLVRRDSDDSTNDTYTATVYLYGLSLHEA